MKWVLREPDSDKALAIRDQYLRQVHELIVPDVFPVEVAHALVRAERKNVFQPPEGALRLKAMLTVLPAVHPSLPLLPRAYEIASAMRCGVYDCLYLCLAEREQCEFITSDEKMIANLQKDFPFIVPLDSIQP